MKKGRAVLQQSKIYPTLLNLQRVCNYLELKANSRSGRDSLTHGLNFVRADHVRPRVPEPHHKEGSPPPIPPSSSWANTAPVLHLLWETFHCRKKPSLRHGRFGSVSTVLIGCNIEFQRDPWPAGQCGSALVTARSTHFSPTTSLVPPTLFVL